MPLRERSSMNRLPLEEMRQIFKDTNLKRLMNLHMKEKGWKSQVDMCRVRCLDARKINRLIITPPGEPRLGELLDEIDVAQSRRAPWEACAAMSRADSEQRDLYCNLIWGRMGK